MNIVNKVRNVGNVGFQLLKHNKVGSFGVLLDLHTYSDETKGWTLTLCFGSYALYVFDSPKSSEPVYLSITECTTEPGGRFKADHGKDSGEYFRDAYLIPTIQNALSSRAAVIVDLDGVSGYASSFLDEAFGTGLLTKLEELGITDPKEFLEDRLNIKSTDQPSLMEEVFYYINNA